MRIAMRMAIGRARDCQRPFPASGRCMLSSAIDIFDRIGKKRHRTRAATAENWNSYQYLRTEIAPRLIDRLDDIMRDFPTALELGAYGSHVATQIRAVKGVSGRGGAGGIETLVRLGVCEAGLSQPIEAGEGEVKVLDIVGDEEFLPFAPHTFDLVVSNLSLHWVNDLPGALQQVRQAIKPDGVFLASMLGGKTLNELRIAMQLAESEREGGVSPHISPAAQISDCGGLLQSAGFAIPTVDVDTITVLYPNALALMEHLQGMGESNAVKARRHYVSRDTFLAAASIYQTMFGHEDGSVPATFQVAHMIGWAPSASQPQALARGSGQVSMKTLDRRKMEEDGTDKEKDRD